MSIVAHAALIAWGVFALTAQPPLDPRAIESIPVSMVIDESTKSPVKAASDAKPVATPPLPTPAVAPQPAPEPKPVQVAKAEPKAAPAPAQKPAAETPAPVTAAAASPSPVALPTPSPRVAPKPPAATPVKVAKPDEAFDIDRITAVLDKLPQQPAPAPGPAPPKPVATAAPPPPKTMPQPAQPVPDTVGLSSLIATANLDAHMTASEVDALRSRIAQCWTPPPGWTDPAEVRVVLIIALNPDGSVAATPEVVSAPAGKYQQTAPESAVRAVRACAPYVLPPAKYGDWKEVKITFDPRAMTG